jgi:hypothetical protein
VQGENPSRPALPGCFCARLLLPLALPHRRGGRAVECAGLENRYGLSVHRGFESPPLRWLNRPSRGEIQPFPEPLGCPEVIAEGCTYPLVEAGLAVASAEREGASVAEAGPCERPHYSDPGDYPVLHVAMIVGAPDANSARTRTLTSRRGRAVRSLAPQSRCRTVRVSLPVPRPSAPCHQGHERWRQLPAFIHVYWPSSDVSNLHRSAGNCRSRFQRSGQQQLDGHDHRSDDWRDHGCMRQQQNESMCRSSLSRIGNCCRSPGPTATMTESSPSTMW